MLDSINYPATISNWVMLIKSDIIKNNKLKYIEGVKYSEDLLFGSQVMYYTNRFYYLKGECYYNYINNPASATNTYYEKKYFITTMHVNVDNGIKWLCEKRRTASD